MLAHMSALERIRSERVVAILRRLAEPERVVDALVAARSRPRRDVTGAARELVRAMARP